MKKQLLILSILVIITCQICLADKGDKWMKKSTLRFDLFFQDTNDLEADEISTLCKSEYERMSEILGTDLYYHTQFTNSKFNFKELKIAIYLKKENGFGNNLSLIPKQILSRKLEIDYSQDFETVKSNLQLMIAQVIVGNMIAGPRNKYRKGTLKKVKPWFYLGGACYIATKGTWEKTIHDVSEDVMEVNIEKLKGIEAMYAGEQVFKCIESQYGELYIKNIVNLTMIILHERRAISGTLGISYSDFAESCNITTRLK